MQKTNEPLIVQRLNGGENLDDLVTQYHLKAKRHNKYPELVMLHYDQLESPLNERLVQECRGLILGEHNGKWGIVSYPFVKFWNYGEGQAADIDWSTAQAQEKLDGSLMTLYFYDDEWQVASRGTPDASGNIHDGDKTFCELFWETWHALGYVLPYGYEKRCFMFELCTPENRVVVRHQKPRLIAIGARCLQTGKEKNIRTTAFVHGWEWVEVFPLESLADIQVFADTLNPLEQEGFVVVDKDFNRIKIKSPAYVALHHMRDGLEVGATKRLLEIARLGEISEVVAHFPEYQEKLERIDSILKAAIDDAQSLYDQHKHLESQKDYAMKVKDHPLQGVLFGVRKGHYKSISEGVREMRIEKLAEILKL